MSSDPVLRTLQLVTTPVGFFDQQVRVLERNGISCTVVPVPGRKRGRSLPEYVRFEGRVLGNTIGGDFDLVQANHGLTGPAAVTQPSRPVVIWYWGTELTDRFRQVHRACAALADAVIVMSEEMADKLGQPCHIVRHGVDSERFRPVPREEARAELGWDPHSKHVLFPYDPSRSVKNFPRAESVVDRVDDELGGDVELQVVYGVPHERMPVYMNAADALVLTSDVEGSPNAVREALACNLPVVSVDVGDIAERVAGVDHCHVCATDDELVACLTDVLDSGVRSDGRKRIDEFSLERMMSDLVAVYDDVLDDDRLRGYDLDVESRVRVR